MIQCAGFSNIKGLLIDLEGVLYVGPKLIEGATEIIQKLKSQDIPLRFLTNTTTKSLRTLHEKLTGLGLPIEKEEIISAPQAAIRYLSKQPNPSVYLVLNEDAKEDFKDFSQKKSDVEFVIVGDIGEKWTYDLLNKIFSLVIEGATLVGLHKGKYWQAPEGLKMDIGAFITGIEYASRKEAIIMGKPSKDFFQMALEDIGYSADDVLMIGDDIDSDIGGGQQAGIRGILVQTGKYRKELVEKSPIEPDAVIASIVNLIES